MIKREAQREHARQMALAALRKAGRALTLAEWASLAGVSVKTLAPMVATLHTRGEIRVSRESKRAGPDKQTRLCLVVDPVDKFSGFQLSVGWPSWLVQHQTKDEK